MEAVRIRRVEFIGGPFDGFHEEIWDDANELPPCVAIPLNERAARTLGMPSAALKSHRKVIYLMQIEDSVARYYFQSTSGRVNFANPAGCSSNLREPPNAAE